MKVAAVADIHGNLPALEAALREIEVERPDLIVVCGDVASGPMPAETIDALRSLTNARFVRGNADRGLIDEFDGKAPAPMPGPFVGCAKEINRAQRDFLAGFEATVTIDAVDGLGRVLFCHAASRCRGRCPPPRRPGPFPAARSRRRPPPRPQSRARLRSTRPGSRPRTSLESLYRHPPAR